jgi:hypothetical protein
MCVKEEKKLYINNDGDMHLLMMSGRFLPLLNRPVARWSGVSMPYGGESARASVTRKLLLPLSTRESPKTKKLRAASTGVVGRSAPSRQSTTGRRETAHDSDDDDAMQLASSQLDYSDPTLF